ncbi:MAG: 50S ribosomal protein L30 [Eubacteriales bacterium]
MAKKAKQVKIKYVKSSIGYSQRQKDTVKALGLGKLGSEVTKDLTPEIQGMINKVSHLVKAEEV